MRFFGYMEQKILFMLRIIHNRLVVVVAVVDVVVNHARLFNMKFKIIITALKKNSISWFIIRDFFFIKFKS
jgi:hypothetical protein